MFPEQILYDKYNISKRQIYNKSYVYPTTNKFCNVNLILIPWYLYLQASVLGVITEHSLSLTMAPVLIDLAKDVARDKKALDGLSMDRTSASYKLTYGLRKTFTDYTLNCIRGQPFSLNIDESTSSNDKRVLAVLVSYYSKTECKVVCEHLAAVEMVKVDTEALLGALENLFNNLSVPWNNLVSILMDSAAVMRGSKSGLEKRIREEKTPKLLDIDGDICHNIHNATKKLCGPFGFWVEGLLHALHADHKWSADLRELLCEICLLLGIKFTRPERFVQHRWLSCFDVALSTLKECGMPSKFFIMHS